TTGGALGTTLTLQAPITGNLIVVSTPAEQVNQNITGVTDSDNNTYHYIGDNTGSAQMWYAIGVTPDPNLRITLHQPGSPSQYSIRVDDVNNATAYDTNGVNDGAGCSSVTSIAHQPDITPTHAPGLVIATMGIGQGPGLGVTSPPGAIWDFI